MQSPAVILVSGGMDSAVLLHHVAQRLEYDALHALSFQYGQRHCRELEMAEWQCAHCPAVASWRTVDIGFYGEVIGAVSALAAEGCDVPDLAAIPDDQRDQPVTYVPNRNLVMLAIAAGHAESLDCQDVFYGAQAQDEYGYWDCTREFVERLNGVLALNRRQPVRIHAPFNSMRKADELRLGLELGVDFGHTWTCYRGGVRPCGTCPSCVERHQAFVEVGVDDPLFPTSD